MAHAHYTVSHSNYIVLSYAVAIPVCVVPQLPKDAREAHDSPPLCSSLPTLTSKRKIFQHKATIHALYFVAGRVIVEYANVCAEHLLRP